MVDYASWVSHRDIAVIAFVDHFVRCAIRDGLLRIRVNVRDFAYTDRNMMACGPYFISSYIITGAICSEK